MNPFDDNFEALENELKELEPGVYFERLNADEESLRFPETPDDSERLVFGMTDGGEGWNYQLSPVGDAAASIFSVREAFSGTDASQEAFIEALKSSGLYSELCGMTLADVENCVAVYLEQDDIPVYIDYGELDGLNDLCAGVDSGEEVLCYVNGAVLYNGDLGVLPGLNADQIVRVTGVDLSNDEDEYVVLNDTSRKDGAGRQIPLDNFMKAWSANSCYAITVSPRKNHAN